ncbi:MAG TPA: helix-turn-helix transcriptional regulator [Thermoanaerobaculaceae bacterium]|nr:helix-turn-helix transcriptional regulator [Thermoanaerobaculaceae bacterium]
MKHPENYRAFVERVTASVEYKVDVAALEFVEDLVRRMSEAGVSQAELARRLAASEAYVSKVLRGDTNFTLATMVKLATAVGHELHVHIAPAGSSVQWFDVVTPAQGPQGWPRMANARRSSSANRPSGGAVSFIDHGPGDEAQPPQQVREPAADYNIPKRVRAKATPRKAPNKSRAKGNGR